MNAMYPDTKTWSPFVGCRYDCKYCRPSFQRQLKRVAGLLKCQDCHDYEPHYHPERLATGKIPSAPIVFVNGTGDITFCKYSFMREIFDVIGKHRPRIDKIYYFQSKNPVSLNQYLDWFLANQERVILLTTLETNRDIGYRKISQAPLPTVRFSDFYDLDYPRKVLTIEPVLDFDLVDFVEMVLKLHDQGTLEYVWFGFDSKRCGLPEPSIDKAQKFVDVLHSYGIEVRGKSLRGVKLKAHQPFLKTSFPSSSKNRIRSPISSLNLFLAATGIVTCPFVDSLAEPRVLSTLMHLFLGLIGKHLNPLPLTILTCKLIR